MAASPASLWAAQEFAKGLALAVESMTGSKMHVQVEEIASQPEALSEPDTLWWQQALSHSPEAMVRLGIPAKSWKGIGESVLTAALIEQVDTAMARDTFREITGQAFGAIAQALSARFGHEVTCLAPDLSEAQDKSFPFTLTVLVGDETLRLYLAVPDAAVEALSPPPEQTRKPTPANPAQAATALTLDPSQAKRLDLLLDVQLPVSVSFGQSQLALKDVIKLTTGSIVELNRTVSEPVEVVVNNCVIARGEVVVVEGNFGVRIQQVVSRQERLRSLK